MSSDSNLPGDSQRQRLILGAAVFGTLGVLLGAFGAHGLDGILEGRGYDAELIAKRLAQFDTGVRYQLIHAVALLALASLTPATRSTAAGPRCRSP